MNKSLILTCLLICTTVADAQNASALRVGDSLFALGNYNKAITFYKQVENSEAKIARAYQMNGNSTKALYYYQKAIQKETGLLTRYQYGKLLLSSGKLQKADSLFKALIQESPKNPEFVYQLGLAKEKQNDSTAIITYMNALNIDNEHQDALYKVAKLMAEKRNFNGAIDRISQGLEADPLSTRFLNLKAIVYFVNKEYHTAAATYEKLLELNQSNEQLHENLAESYRQTNRFEEAIDQYTILINTYDDKVPKWHYNIAKCFEALRYLDKAKYHYEIAILLQDLPVDDSYIALASVFFKQKDFKNQFEALTKAVRENPENQRAKYLLATAADNYFEDDSAVIAYYEAYLKTFGEQGQFAEYAKARIKDLKTDLHMNKN